MRHIKPEALLWIGLSVGIGVPAAANPLPNSALALLEARHLDRLPPVTPWEGLQSIILAESRQALHPTTQRSSCTGRWLTAMK